MNYGLEDWYNELYRIFSCNQSLLTQSQTVLVGDCLRSLMAGENITYKLESLYQACRAHDKIKEPLENYLHRYIDNVKEDSIEQSQPKVSKEELNDGILPEQNINKSVGTAAGSTASPY